MDDTARGPAPLRLRQQVFDEVIADCLRDPAHERAGLIGGIDDLGIAVYPVPNRAADPKTRFALDPHHQIEAMRRMRERGETLFAIYHSHPTSEAVPSARDQAEAAYPNLGYLIVSLQTSPPTMGVFAYDGTRFLERALRVADGDW